MQNKCAIEFVVLLYRLLLLFLLEWTYERTDGLCKKILHSRRIGLIVLICFLYNLFHGYESTLIDSVWLLTAEV